MSFLNDVIRVFNQTDGGDDGDGNQWQDQVSGQRDLYTQVVIALAMGLSAFFGFCVRVVFVGFFFQATG